MIQLVSTVFHAHWLWGGGGWGGVSLLHLVSVLQLRRAHVGTDDDYHAATVDRNQSSSVCAICSCATMLLADQSAAMLMMCAFDLHRTVTSEQ